MSPAIAVLTNYNYKKVEGEWHTLAKVVTEHNKPVLAVLLVITLLSVGVLPLLETNIDYLDMLYREKLRYGTKDEILIKLK